MDRKLSPLKIVVLYAVFGSSWILFSDLLLSTITKDPEIFAEISIAKGWLYVVLTAALMYWLIGLYSKQRTRSEIALSENEQGFRVFFESHGSVMMLIDPVTGSIVDANLAAADFYGFTRDTLRSMVISDINMLPAEELATLRRRAAANPYNLFVVPNRAAGKKIRTVEVHTSPIEVNQRKLLFSIIHDVTERERAEATLRESEERYRTLAEATFEGVGFSERGILFDVNSQLARMLGYELQEIIGRSILEFIVPEDRELVKQNIDMNREPAYENRLLRKDGSTLIVETKARHFNYQGRNVRVTAVHDITERKQAEEELNTYRSHLEELIAQRTKEISVLNDQLRQSQKLEAVGILAGGIAHEFNNILTTMNGSMYLIQKKLPEESPAKQYVEQVVASIGKATELSQGLLTFSRKQKSFLRPVHVNGIIRSVGKMLKQLIGEDIELSTRLTDKDPVMMADVNQIEQVLINLAANARDAIPDGGRLTIGTDIVKMNEEFERQHGYGVPGEYVALTVSDNGTGIEEAIKGQIFEPFFTTKAVGKGSGLGLAVTYGIVKQHNGFIDVESLPAEGTTFTIYFPTVEAEVIRPVSQDRSLAIGGEETVLLAEDDVDARTTMSEMLRLNGYNVLEAGDGEEAIRVYEENKDRVQLVFIDVRMPKKNAREVYEEIKAVYPRTRFLFISGYTADIIDSLGATDEEINFVSKAASPDEILRKIREVVDQ